MVCDRLTTGALTECAFASQLASNRASCIAALDSDGGRRILAKQGPCFVEHDNCDDVADCVADAAVDKSDLRACSGSDSDRTVGIPKADWPHRKGADVTRYADATSSKSSPIEMCGLPAENDWLVAAACNDGSHPLHVRSDAERARVGNVGTGGRCNSIIDEYRIKCPETTYDVFVDAYVCPLPE